jgi:transposase
VSVARPTKYTRDRKKRLLDALRDGNTRRAACMAAGIDQDTLANWAQRFSDFSEELTRAEAEAEVALVGIIRAAAPQDWRAALTLLERRWPNEWGKRERIDVYEHERAQQEAERIAARFRKPVDEVLQRAGIAAPTRN